MKKMKLIALGTVLAGGTLVLAQDAQVIQSTPPPDDVLIAQEVATTLSGQNAQLAATANHMAELAKTHADAQTHTLLAQAGGGGAGFTGWTGGGLFDPSLMGSSHQRPPRTLVIPNDAGDIKSLGEVEEDLGVMAHILDKAVSSGDKAARAMGIAVYSRFMSAAALPQNLYIDGHGAVFLLKVNYPLLPPPAKEEKEPAKESVNNEWEEARREIASPTKPQTGGDPFEILESRYGADAGFGTRLTAGEYDADKVESLKKDLIAALKNAANIRRLKSDELVTVVVAGADAGQTKTFRSASAKPGEAKGERMMTATASIDRTRASDPGKLIIRARKADAEAFQNGKLDFDAFRNKVTIMLY